MDQAQSQTAAPKGAAASKTRTPHSNYKLQPAQRQQNVRRQRLRGVRGQEALPRIDPDLIEERLELDDGRRCMSSLRLLQSRLKLGLEGVGPAAGGVGAPAVTRLLTS